MSDQCSVNLYCCYRQLGHVDEKRGIPVHILLFWSKAIFKKQTKCFCAFRHECLLRCKDILLLKAFYFWEYFVAYLFMEYGKKHTLLILNMRTMPVANHLQRSVLICWKHVFSNMLLTTTISLQFVASFDVEARW